MSTWLTDLTPAVPARRIARIVAIPHAGGWSSSFLPWRASLPADTGLFVAELPGRGARSAETNAASLNQIVTGIAQEIAALPAASTTLLGHSFGAIVAYEVARYLEQHGEPATQLVVSARQPPCFPSVAPFSYRQDDEVLIRHLINLGGMDARIRDRPEALRHFLPAIRADLELLETHRRPPRPCTTPIVAVHADQDPVVDGDRLPLWNLETTSIFQFRTIPGDHFAIYRPENLPRLLQHRGDPRASRSA